jgi:DNA-binding transcriptional ArsR family regulator
MDVVPIAGAAPAASGAERERLFRRLLDAVASAIAHPGRRLILELLAEHGELSPGELAAAFPGIDRRSVSKQLQLLRRAGLVSARRRQRYVIDRRDPPEVQALKALSSPQGRGIALLYTLERPGLALLRMWLTATFWRDAPEGPMAAASAAEPLSGDGKP